MTFGTILRLGRVSNLPTVWTNALAGAALASGGAPDLATVAWAALALTLYYEGGMWLNDAFDAEIDAKERANRPIPMGEIGRGTVFAGGYAMLAAGIAIAFMLGPQSGWAGVALAIAVVLYDWLHKRTVLSPVIMGATRFLSYALAALAAGAVAAPSVVGPANLLWALIGAVGLFAWIVGLTYAAKQEAYDRIGAAWPLAVLAVPFLVLAPLALSVLLALVLWIALAGVAAFAIHRLFRRNPGDVPKAVVTMIAGVSLYDAALIASTGATVLAVLAAAGFVLTLALQKVASGT